MKKFLEWLRVLWREKYIERDSLINKIGSISQERDKLLDQSFELATKYKAAETGRKEIAHDYAIELRESAENQLQMDIFQQALTNTFSPVDIKTFFNNCDELREVHENAKANAG